MAEPANSIGNRKAASNRTARVGIKRLVSPIVRDQGIAPLQARANGRR